MFKYIITGTGRCGTTYLSRIFNEIGIKCGHELIFNLHYNYEEGMKRYPELEADSSWMSVPFLDFLSNSACIHIVRHPLKTIASFKNVGFLKDEDNVYSKFVYEHLPEIRIFKNYDEKLAFYYLEWNQRCKRAENYAYHKVEDDIQFLLKRLGIMTNKKFEKFYDNPYDKVIVELDKMKIKDKFLYENLKNEIINY